MSSKENLRAFVCVAELSTIETRFDIPGQTEYTVIKGDYTEAQYNDRPTRVIIHGFMGASDSSDFKEIEKAYRKLDVNIVIVKWSRGSLYYTAALDYVPKVGAQIAKFLDKHLGTNEKSWKDLKLVGHSLGAHIAGFTAKKVVNGKVGTIIALDPAGWKLLPLNEPLSIHSSLGPGFKKKGQTERLNESDAEYTECIYTGIDCYGNDEKLCQANFYPNKGLRQPGCGSGR